MSIGFYQPRETLRSPIYSLSGRKLAYLEDGGWVTDTEGFLIARIIRYHEDAAPTACKDACGSTFVAPDSLHEV